MNMLTVIVNGLRLVWAWVVELSQAPVASIPGAVMVVVIPTIMTMFAVATFSNFLNRR